MKSLLPVLHYHTFDNRSFPVTKCRWSIAFRLGVMLLFILSAHTGRTSSTAEVTKGEVHKSLLINQKIASVLLVINSDEAIINKAEVNTAENASDTEVVTAAVLQGPSVSLDVSADREFVSSPNEAINYTYIITNTGNTVLTGIEISDDAPGNVKLDADVLLPSEETMGFNTYPINRAMLAAGTDIVNNVVVKTAEGATANASVTVSILAEPELTLTKSADPGEINASGQEINYKISIKNSGDVDIANITVTDPMIDFEEVIDLLAPDQEEIYDLGYITTQYDVDEGRIYNVVYAEGTVSDDILVIGQDDVTITVIQDAQLEINVESPAGYDAVDDVIVFECDIKNTGNVTITDIKVTDELTGYEEIVASLSPGDNQILAITHIISQTDVNAGSISNTISAVGTGPDDEAISISAEATVTGTQISALSLSKTTAQTTYNAVGDEITYNFEVENTGNVTITDLTITDEMLELVKTITSLVPGAKDSFSEVYIVTQSDIDAGSIDNSALVSGKDPDGETVTASDEATVTGSQSPGLTVTKTASPATFNAAGDEIEYTIEVVNSGNVTISAIIVSDPLLNLERNIVSLSPGASQSITGSYTITQSDVNSGSFTNTVSVSGSDPGGNAVNDDDEATVTGSHSPSLTVTKTASPATFNAAGDEIEYTIEVVNSGNVTISAITVSDPLLNLERNIASLAPGASQSITGSYTITQSDVNSGSFTNTVSVSGSDPGGNAVNDDDEATVTGSQSPSLTVTKTASPATFNAAGDEIDYTIEVVNSGNVTISAITVSDPLLNLESNIVSLAPGASQSITDSYTITQADVNLGSFTNSVSVSGSAPGGTAVVDEDEATVTGSQSPALAISKTASPANYDAVGNEITYTIVVENSGNVTISAVLVSDPLLDMEQTIGNLEPGATRTLTETYTVTQSDINEGSITNTVTASGRDPGNNAVSVQDDVTITAEQNAALVVTKTATPETFGSVGDVIAYDIVVENTGNVTVTGITVNDPLAGLNQTIANLQPGASRSFTATYTIVQADINSRSVTNTVSVSGMHGNIPVQADDDVTVEALLSPVANDDVVSDILTGNAAVIGILENDLLNDRTQALPNLVTVDLNLQQSGLQTQLTVAGEGVWNYNSQSGELTFTPGAGFTTDPSPITYRLTEIATGLSDDALVTVDYNEGEPFAFNDISSGNEPGEPVTLNILANDKLSDGSQALANQVTLDLDPSQAGIQLEINVEGEGNWKLNPETGDLTFTPAPGFTTNPTPIVYSLTENLTGLSDTGSVIIGYSEQPPVANDDVGTGYEPGTPAVINILENDELSDGSSALPEMVTVDLNTSLAGIQDEITIQGEGLWKLNSATGEVTFTPQSGFTGTTSAVTYRLSENLTGLHDDATIRISYDEEAPVASDDSSTGHEPGTEVSISILDNDRLSDGSPAAPDLVTVDLNLSEEGVQVELVIPGEGTWRYDAENGLLIFIPQQGYWEDPAPVTYRLCGIWNPDLCDEAVVTIDYDQSLQVASIGLVKTGSFNSADDNIIYSFEVTNTGNIPVWDILISDERIGVNNLSVNTDTLRPGDTAAATAIYQVTQADRDSGSVTNSALAVGITYNNEQIEDISGSRTNNDEPTVTPLIQNPSLLVEKEAVLFTPVVAVNDVVDYTISVSNNGNVVITDVRITDPLTGFEQDVGNVFPGEFFSYQTSYSVQINDERNGMVENIAIVTGTAPDGSIVESRDTAVVDVEQCEMIIPTGFSPNDDGIQDTWRITCLELFPDARIEIFNRWGNRVYERRNYGNTDVHGTADAWWDGYSTNKRTFGSSRLPAGTYYYILYLQDDQQPISGFVFLNR